MRGHDECVAARFGEGRAAGPERMAELSRVVRDYRELWNSVVSVQLDTALAQRIADSNYAAGVLLKARRDADKA